MGEERENLESAMSSDAVAKKVSLVVVGRTTSSEEGNWSRGEEGRS